MSNKKKNPPSYTKIQIATVKRVLGSKGDPYVALGLPHGCTDHVLIQIAKHQGAVLLSPSRNPHTGAADALDIFTRACATITAPPKGQTWRDTSRRAQREQDEELRRRQEQSERDRQRAQEEKLARVEAAERQKQEEERQAADVPDVSPSYERSWTIAEKARRDAEYAEKMHLAQLKWLQHYYLRQLWERQRQHEEHWKRCIDEMRSEQRRSWPRRTFGTMLRGGANVSSAVCDAAQAAMKRIIGLQANCGPETFPAFQGLSQRAILPVLAVGQGFQMILRAHLSRNLVLSAAVGVGVGLASLLSGRRTVFRFRPLFQHFSIAVIRRPL